MTVLPVLDRAYLSPLANLREPSGRSTLEAVVDAFQATAGAHLAALSTAIASGDPEAIRRGAHALRSGAAAIGAMRLVSLSNHVPVDHHGARARLIDINSAFDETMASLGAFQEDAVTTEIDVI